MMIKDKVMTFDYSAAPSLCSENLVCLYAQLPTISRNCGCFRDCKSIAKQLKHQEGVWTHFWAFYEAPLQFRMLPHDTW